MTDAAPAQNEPSQPQGDVQVVEDKEAKPAAEDDELKLVLVDLKEKEAEASQQKLSLVPAEDEGPAVVQKAPRKQGKGNLQLVPLFVQERGHGKDGELLRDFILRRVHLQKDFRDAALNRWLIREDFFDEFFPEYMKQYDLPGSNTSEAESQSDQLVEAAKDILVLSQQTKKKVSDLEAIANSESPDVHQLRDTLLVAVKDLTVPRRVLGQTRGDLMSDAAKEDLKRQEQKRLRQVVFRCLKGIWDSGVGGEVLKMAMDAVRSRIERFKSKSGETGDVIQAMAGHEWAQLEDLVQMIDEKLEAGGQRAPLHPVEGRRTKLVIERALDALGGQGTLRDVIEWIEKHPEELAQIREAKLNRNVRDGQRKPVWHRTVGSMISFFRKVPRAGPPTQYLSSKAPEPQEPLPAIQDAKPKEPRPKRATQKRKEEAEGGGDAGDPATPKKKRIRKMKADAGGDAAPAPEAAAAGEVPVPETAQVAPQQPADPIDRALDAAAAEQAAL